MISTENTKKMEVNVEITKPQTSQYVNTEKKPLNVSLYIQFFGIIVCLYIQTGVLWITVCYKNLPISI